MAAHEKQKFLQILCLKCSFVTFLIAIVCITGCSTSQFSIPDIENAALRSCVILIEGESDTSSDLADEKIVNHWILNRQKELRRLFMEAKQAISRSDIPDLDVTIGTLKNGHLKIHDKNLRWSDSLPIIFKESRYEKPMKLPLKINHSSLVKHEVLTEHFHSPLIIGFRKRKRDRSCLIKPDGYVADMPESFLYSGELDLFYLIDFINTVCNLYMYEDGHESSIGRLRRSIISNVHRLNRYSGYSTMFDFYMSGQKNPFLHGLLHEEARKTLEDTSLKMAQCDRIDLANWYSFNNMYVFKSKPVIIRNITNNWPAFKKWTNKFLRSKFSNNKVHVKLAPNGIFEGTEKITQWENHEKFYIPEKVRSQLMFTDQVVVRPAPGSMTFGEFMDFTQSPTEAKKNVSAYIEYASIEEYMPGLSEDIREMTFLDEAFKNGHLHHKNVWLSDGNTLGKLHFDAFENFLCQISGHKQLTLFEPHENHQMYEAHIQEAELSFDKSEMKFRRRNLKDSTSMVMSPVDILKPDFGRFPLFRDAVPINCTIGPGEVLYLPSYWWHEVQSTPDAVDKRNLAVNFWYDPFLIKEFPCPECPLSVNRKYDNLLEDWMNEL